MKHFAVLFSGLSLLLSVAGSGQAETLLTAAEVRALFSEKTFTVTTGPGKNNGREHPFKVYTSEMGIAKTLFDDETGQTRLWSIGSDDRFCFSSSFNRNRRGKTCGVIVKDGSDYKLYESDEIREKSGRLVGMYSKDLLFIFSDFQDGNKL